MSQAYGLGRGLASLIPQKSKKVAVGNSKDNVQNLRKDIDEHEASAGMRAVEIDIEKISANPFQPRVHFDEEKLKELSASIKNHGVIQPLIVSRTGSRIELIAGERRLQAAKLAGLQKVPVVVHNINDKDKEKLELALIENIQRHNLNPIEEARAFEKMANDFEMEQEEVAHQVGKSRSAVANKLRLLKLPVEAQKALIHGEITEGHAKAILSLENKEKQLALFQIILKNNLTVRQTEDKTKEISVRTHKRKIQIDPQVKNLENILMGVLGTKVKVKKSGGGGKIIIEYYSKEELNNILKKIKI